MYYIYKGGQKKAYSCSYGTMYNKSRNKLCFEYLKLNLLLPHPVTHTHTHT